MGMFDDIKVPVAYLRGILDKKTEKLFDDNVVFQTKSLENACITYKVHRRQLYKGGMLNGDLWEKDTFTGAVDFYTSVKDEDETEYWFDFKFTFKAGKLDSKEFVGTYVLQTKKEKQENETMIKIEQQYFDEYRSKFLVKFWVKLSKIFFRLSNYAQTKTQLPYEVREQSYKASGRLKKDPEALNSYKKIIK
mgnify:CR=1 FL=1